MAPFINPPLQSLSSHSHQLLVFQKKMGRGKIEIKKIENSTNRQVTYSKRRAGIMKKAKELTVLCDAEVALIMISNTRKVSEFVSPGTTMKKVYDRYQQAVGTSLWQSHYERMQDNLNKQREINNNLRREIRQRKGEDLDDLSMQELCGLEQNIKKSVEVVRGRKYHVIATQTDTYKKKIRNLQETHNSLVCEMDQREMDCHFGYTEREAAEYEATVALSNGSSHVFALRLQPSQPNLQDARGYGTYDLRLA